MRETSTVVCEVNGCEVPITLYAEQDGHTSIKWLAKVAVQKYLQKELIVKPVGKPANIGNEWNIQRPQQFGRNQLGTLDLSHLPLSSVLVVDVLDRVSGLRLMPDSPLRDLIDSCPLLQPRILIETDDNLLNNQLLAPHCREFRRIHEKVNQTYIWNDFSRLSCHHRCTNVPFTNDCLVEFRFNKEQLLNQQTSEPAVHPKAEIKEAWIQSDVNPALRNQVALVKSAESAGKGRGSQILWKATVRVSTNENIKVNVLIKTDSMERFSKEKEDEKLAILERAKTILDSQQSKKEAATPEDPFAVLRQAYDSSEPGSSEYCNFVERKEQSQKGIEEGFEKVFSHNQFLQSFLIQKQILPEKEEYSSLKSAIFEHLWPIYRVFQFICALNGDAKWLSMANFRSLLTRAGLMKELKQAGVTFQELWTVVNFRSNVKQTMQVEPLLNGRSTTTINDGTALHFEEFVETLVRVSVLISKEHSDCDQMLKVCYNSICQLLLAEHFVELEHLFTDHTLTHLVSNYQEWINQVFRKFAGVSDKSSPVYTNSSSIKNQHISLKNYVRFIRSLLKDRLGLHNEQSINNVMPEKNHLSTVFFSSQNPVHCFQTSDDKTVEINLLDPEDFLWDIQEWYEGIVRSAVIVFAKLSSLQKSNSNRRSDAEYKAALSSHNRASVRSSGRNLSTLEIPQLLLYRIALFLHWIKQYSQARWPDRKIEDSH